MFLRRPTGGDKTWLDMSGSVTGILRIERGGDACTLVAVRTDGFVCTIYFRYRCQMEDGGKMDSVTLSKLIMVESYVVCKKDSI